MSLYIILVYKILLKICTKYISTSREIHLNFFLIHFLSICQKSDVYRSVELCVYMCLGAICIWRVYKPERWWP